MNGPKYFQDVALFIMCLTSLFIAYSKIASIISDLPNAFGFIVNREFLVLFNSISFI